MATVPEGLASVLHHPGIWRAGRRAGAESAAWASGIAALDARLPGGGWPLGALTEICLARSGLGELSLLLPALAAMTHRQRWVLFVDPPYPLYAPALAAGGLALSRTAAVMPPDPTRTSWATEQALRSGACGAVVAWCARLDDRALRRLQLAAEAAGALAVLIRPLAAATQVSPAALRLQLDRGRELRILRCRGAVGAAPAPFAIDADALARARFPAAGAGRAG